MMRPKQLPAGIQIGAAWGNGEMACRRDASCTCLSAKTAKTEHQENSAMRRSSVVWWAPPAWGAPRRHTGPGGSRSHAAWDPTLVLLPVLLPVLLSEGSAAGKDSTGRNQRVSPARLGLSELRKTGHFRIGGLTVSKIKVAQQTGSTCGRVRAK
jgi:hypothetical protein